MIPKEKAEELIEIFYQNAPDTFGTGKALSHGKSCAKICVDEILKSFDGFMDARKNFRHELEIDAERYWKAVKAEIIRL